MGAVSKTYPILKDNLLQALDKDSLEEAHIVFNKIENNAGIVNQLAGTKLVLKSPSFSLYANGFIYSPSI